MPLQFEWDDAKAEANRRKHRVTFEEAATAFGDPFSITIADPDHSSQEDRLVLLGNSVRRRLLVVVHTINGKVVRIISARRGTKFERTAYEEGNL